MDTIRMVLSLAARLCLVLAALPLPAQAPANQAVAPDRNSAEYRAIAATFDLLQPDREGYIAPVQLKVMRRPAQCYASGAWARVFVHGPGANPWNTPGDVFSIKGSAREGTSPWGDRLWHQYSAYEPKPDKITNPYQDPDGYPAMLCWMWSYPAHRVEVCGRWEAEVDEAAAVARVRPIAEALHSGMIRAGLADGASQAPGAGLRYQAIIEWPALRPGEGLTPTARFVDQHGQPPREPQSIVWRIGGRETSAIQWDGSEVVVELQASVGHQAISETRVLPAWGTTPEPTATAPLDHAPADAGLAAAAGEPVLAPLPGPLGWLPLPASWPQALTSLLAPAALVWIGSLFGGGGVPVRAGSRPAAKDEAPGEEGSGEAGTETGTGQEETATEPDKYAPSPTMQLPPTAMSIYTTPPPLAAHQAFAQTFASSVAPSAGQWTKASWEAATDEERTAWTQALFGQLQGALKFEKPIRLEFEDEPGKTRAGYFSADDPAGPKVVINKPRSDFATRPGEVIDTLAHEVRHACQWDGKRKLESPEVRAACDANIAAGSYVTPEQDYPSYVEQFVEKDATAFAGTVRSAVMTEVYVSKLETMLQTMAALEPKKATLEQIQAFLWENPQHKAAIKQAWSSGKLVIEGMPKPK